MNDLRSALEISLAGSVIAHLDYRHAHSRLLWQDGYWDDPNRPVLGLWFENDPRQRVGGASRLPAWFSNLLPEGRLRQLIANDVGVSANEEAQLLSRIGHDLPGAVQVAPVTRWNSDWKPDADPVAPTPEVAVSSALRFSLAGVAMKFSLLRDSSRMTIPARDTRGDWIIKTPDTVFPHVPSNEYAMMTLAGRVGITVPSIEMIHRDSLPALPSAAWPPNGEAFAYAVERFDRGKKGPTHIEDLAQVRGFYPERKYEGTFQTVANLISRRSDLQSLLDFIRQLAFSIAIGNADLHLKNLSLAYRDGRTATLAPAYDLVSTIEYLPSEHDLALRFGRARHSTELNPDAFERMASKAHPDPRAGSLALDVLGALAFDLNHHWADVAPLMNELPKHQMAVTKRLRWFSDLFG